MSTCWFKHFVRIEVERGGGGTETLELMMWDTAGQEDYDKSVNLIAVSFDFDFSIKTAAALLPQF